MAQPAWEKIGSDTRAGIIPRPSSTRGELRLIINLLLFFILSHLTEKDGLPF
jgi:hypothetical protein